MASSVTLVLIYDLTENYSNNYTGDVKLILAFDINGIQICDSFFNRNLFFDRFIYLINACSGLYQDR